MADVTARLGLPLLAAGQAQKEVLHNEALATLDLLVQARVEAVDLAAPPADPAPGQSWLVGAGATGDWTGHDGEIAAWTGTGWTFAALPDGASLWVTAEGLALRRSGGLMSRIVNAAGLSVGGIQVVGPQARPISGPSGGATVDTEARAVISAILVMLKSHGLIGS